MRPPETPEITDCDAVSRCLETALPARYDATRRVEVEKAALSCLGGSLDAAWKRRACLPRPFGRDIRSKRDVQLAIYRGGVDCSDCVLPDERMLEIEFRETFSPFECKCRGYDVHWTSTTDHPCVPTPAVDPSFWADYWKRQLGAVEGLFESVDGLPAATPEAAARLLAGLPHRLPGSVRIRRYSGRVDVVFLTLDQARRLVRLGDELVAARKDWPVTTPACPDGQFASVELGNFSADYAGFDCVDRRSPEARAETAIRQIVRAARPRRITTRTAPEQCKELEALSKRFSLSDKNHSVELRYVDWMRH